MYLKTPPPIIVAILLVSLHYVSTLPSPTTHSKEAKSKPQETDSVKVRDDDAIFESFLAYIRREEQKTMSQAAVSVEERDEDAEFESFLAYIQREEQRDRDNADDTYTGFFQPRHVIEEYHRTLQKKGTTPDTAQSQD
jgi:hypothetical protein